MIDFTNGRTEADNLAVHQTDDTCGTRSCEAAVTQTTANNWLRRTVAKHWRQAAAYALPAVFGALGGLCGPAAPVCSIALSGAAAALVAHFLEHEDWQHSTAHGVMTANNGAIVASWSYALTREANPSTLQFVVNVTRTSVSRS